MGVRIRPRAPCWACFSDSPYTIARVPRRQIIRCLSSTSSYRARQRIEIPPPFPLAQSCPEPTCACAPTPPMPEGLPIDHDHPLNGTMAAYAQQFIIATGRPDWTSRIEEDGQGEGWGELARGLKKLLGRGGKYADPYNNILVTNSSFPSSPSSSSSTASAFLFPSFKYIPSVPTDIPSETLDVASPTSLTTFLRAFLLPKTLHSMHGSVPPSQREHLTRSPDLASHFPATPLVHSPTVLICGHGGRDMRCGILGPVLQAEFQRVLRTKGYPSTESDGQTVDGPGHANVGLISHIGGHKYAGNVIIYIPPGLKIEGGEVSPLAGKGIWYGRIEPKHVEGIVDETILKGRVVKDHFRGGIGHGGEILRL